MNEIRPTNAPEVTIRDLYCARYGYGIVRRTTTPRGAGWATQWIAAGAVLAWAVAGLGSSGSHPSIDKAFPMSTTYIWQRRHADGTFDLWQEKLTGSVVPEEGVEVEIEGRPWRVIDTVPAPAQSLIRVMLEEAASRSPR